MLLATVMTFMVAPSLRRIQPCHADSTMNTDLFDLGEFEQKGSRATKWGPKEDLDNLVREAQRLDSNLYFDAVLNHRAGGDGTERVKAVEVDPEGT